MHAASSAGVRRGCVPSRGLGFILLLLAFAATAAAAKPEREAIVLRGRAQTLFHLAAAAPSGVQRPLDTLRLLFRKGPHELAFQVALDNQGPRLKSSLEAGLPAQACATSRTPLTHDCGADDRPLSSALPGDSQTADHK
jgi:hypothetical protein